MQPEKISTAGETRNRHKKRLWVLICVLALGAIAVLPLTVSLKRRGTLAAKATSPPASNSVGCLGRIEPEGGVIRVSAPYFAGGPALIAELTVKEGDWVQAGQILAVLVSTRQLQTTLKQAETRVVLARSRIDKVREGAKPADLATVKAEISRWEATMETAQAEFSRYAQLHKTHDVSSSELDQKRLAVETAKREVEQARHRLESLSEVRKTEVAIAEAELDAAIADRNHATVQLQAGVVRAPRQGHVLKTHAKPGEEVGPEGVLELGETGRMVVIAEVYETDIGRIHPGQHATISSDIIAGTLDGTVVEIGSQVLKNSVLPTDPVAFSDARVVKVTIQIPNGKAISNLIYGKVDVVIHP